MCATSKPPDEFINGRGEIQNGRRSDIYIFFLYCESVLLDCSEAWQMCLQYKPVGREQNGIDEN